jgi:3D-(3,5/4)-trihydroxycyclohexane-1,2-dione acylhydrolase (decyclizing)
MKSIRLTVAQAVIKYLNQQYVEREGKENKFFAGCFGILGHGNVAGMGQAIQQQNGLKYYQCRNEQSMVHTAAAYAKMKNRLSTFICTTSIGPGATNMITAAAGATINRLPVLLIPGDIFAKRNVAPVLQQLESANSQDFSVNDCFKPISKYWDRINRPEQILFALPEVMRVLTSPAETGTVTLAIPQDVQAEAFDYPLDFFEKKTWSIARPRPDLNQLERAVEMIKKSEKPLIIAGGGAHYSDALETLKKFVHKTHIPLAETFAG